MKQVVVIIWIMSSLFMFDIYAGEKIECERFSDLRNHYSKTIEPVVPESEFMVQDFAFSSNKGIKTVLATTKLGCGSSHFSLKMQIETNNPIEKSTGASHSMQKYYSNTALLCCDEKLVLFHLKHLS